MKDGFAVEKDEGEIKKRYLQGIASGLKTDAHDERMTTKAIKSFMEQGNSGEILLYPDVHGIQATNDIGRLIKAEILKDGPNVGDWFTKFELYDGSEGAQEYQIQKADVMWNQINGLNPYKRKSQKGFSIEGWIPDEGIVEMEELGGRRVIDKVELDGVVIVPRPAYEDSIAHAVFKALGEKSPWQIQKDLINKLKEKINKDETENKYFRSKWEVNDALEESIEEIMTKSEIDDKGKSLGSLFDEYKNIMLDLIMNSQTLFVNDSSDGDAIVKSPYGGNKEDAKLLHKHLYLTMDKLVNSFMKGGNNG